MQGPGLGPRLLRFSAPVRVRGARYFDFIRLSNHPYQAREEWSAVVEICRATLRSNSTLA